MMIGVMSYYLFCQFEFCI